MQTLTNHYLSKITSVFITSINDKFQNLTALVIEIYGRVTKNFSMLLKLVIRQHNIPTFLVLLQPY